MTIARADDVSPMDELETNDPRPEEVRFWEIRLRGNAAGEIELSYNRVASYTLLRAGQPLPGGGTISVDETIASVVEDIIAGTKPTGWQPPTNNRPWRSRLSIANNKYRYEVFILEGDNCQFAEQSLPFRVATGKDSYFFESRCVWVDHLNQVHVTLTPPPGVISKIAYFISHSDLDISGIPSPFNIYLDLKFQDGSLVPITVDPDVGYPGGHN